MGLSALKGKMAEDNMEWVSFRIDGFASYASFGTRADHLQEIIKVSQATGEKFNDPVLGKYVESK